MNSVIDWIRSLFGHPKSIGAITRPMNKIVRDLETYSEKQATKSEKADKRVSVLKEKASNCRSEATAAQTLAGNYKGLIMPSTAE